MILRRKKEDSDSSSPTQRILSSRGLVSSNIDSLALDSKFTLVKVVWNMRF